MLSLFSCDEDVQEQSNSTVPEIDTVMRLPAIADGIPVDTSQTFLMINVITSTDTTVVPEVYAEYSPVTNSTVINVYADSMVAAIDVDSIINEIWKGEDVRLIGVNNGVELGIPFHGLHRFPPQPADHNTLPREYFNLRIKVAHSEVNDWTNHYSSEADFFAPFYSDAFSPFDSSSKYPSRMRHSVDGLMSEATFWDGVNFRQGPDSAQQLAAYNEFVNKLEIFDKAGPFWTMRVAMIDVTYDETVAWGRLMKVVGDHYHHLQTKRNAAKQYLADYIANKGSDPSKEFTPEDLRLLYPDRLRWNGFISGEFESRYDADMLTVW